MGSIKGSYIAEAFSMKVILITGTPPLGDKEMVVCLLTKATSSASGILSSLGGEESLILWICCGQEEGTILKARLLKHTGFLRRKIKSSEAVFQNEAEVGVGGGESLRLQGTASENPQEDHGNISDTGQQERRKLLGSPPELGQVLATYLSEPGRFDIRGRKNRTTAQTHHLSLDPRPPLCSPVESSF